MIIFSTFSLVAGGLVALLPETRDRPLPETLRDAVFISETNGSKFDFFGLNDGKSSVSLVARESAGASTVQPPEEQAETATTSPRRSETTTSLATSVQLPAIPEVSDAHESMHGWDGEETEDSRNATPTPADEFIHIRQRHPAGSTEREVEWPGTTNTTNSTNGSQNLKDPSALSAIEKLSEISSS
ncbi:Organic cation transporter-like protein [Aphelenchoides fujianensis]|nr:Organic cation transporter-like protein [Aphelenchoides fujianensis]